MQRFVSFPTCDPCPSGFVFWGNVKIKHQACRPPDTVTMTHLKAVFPSPPARVLFRRHVYDWHNVPHLDHRESDDENKVWSQLSTLKRHYGWISIMINASLQSYLKGELVCGLGCVTLGDVCCSDRRDVDWSFLRHQQMVPLVVNLENEKNDIKDVVTFGEMDHSAEIQSREKQLNLTW